VGDQRTIADLLSVVCSPIEAQRRVSLHQFPISLQRAERLSRIESLLVFCNDHSRGLDEGSLLQKLECIAICLLHAIRRIQKDKAHGDLFRFQLSQRLQGVHLDDLKTLCNLKRREILAN